MRRARRARGRARAGRGRGRRGRPLRRRARARRCRRSATNARRASSSAPTAWARSSRASSDWRNRARRRRALCRRRALRGLRRAGRPRRDVRGRRRVLRAQPARCRAHERDGRRAEARGSREWSADVDAGVGGAAAELGRGVRSFAGATRIGARVSIGPLAHDVRRASAPGALLVGDAAGFLDPFTGQGVFLALTGAERAADAVLARCATPAREPTRSSATRAQRRRRRAGGGGSPRAFALLIDVPPLARRAAARLARLPDAGAALLDALAGVVPPQRAFASRASWAGCSRDGHA